MTSLMHSSTPQTLEQLRNAFAGAGDRRQLDAVFGSAMRGYGFTAYAAGFVPDAVSPAQPNPANPRPFLLLNWPVSWLELYARQGFALEDVTLTEATSTSEPFTWGEVQRRRPGASAHIFAAAERFGWQDGLVIPVHDPSGVAGERFGLINLAAPTLRDFSSADRISVTQAALAAFGASRRFDQSPETAPSAVRLSAREAEALTFVAAGLSDDEIARRLSISRSTAHHHVESARKKLNAASRAQAVAIALTKNLV